MAQDGVGTLFCCSELFIVQAVTAKTHNQRVKRTCVLTGYEAML